LVRTPACQAGGRRFDPGRSRIKLLRNQGLFCIMNYYIYILESKTGKFYIGQSANLEARLERHNSNRVKSTKFKGPWKVIYTERYSSRSEAMIREKQLKKWRRELLLNLIKGTSQ